MTIQEYDAENKVISQREINESLFAVSADGDVITQAIVATKNNLRQGSACAKTRAEVNYSTHKPWRQKGTGRARAGMRKSPIWVKGGVIFPPRPRKFRTNLPKKVKNLAFKMAFYMKLKDQNIFLLKNFSPSHRTKEVLVNFRKIPFLEAPKTRTLIIYDNENSFLNLAFRNVGDKFTTIPWESVCTYDIVKHDKVLITSKAFENLEKRVGNVKE